MFNLLRLVIINFVFLDMPLLNLITSQLSSITAISTGMISSFTHVVTGPDHLAAVTPMSVQNNRIAWRIGIAWGIGHLTGIAVIGGLFLLFKEDIPLEAISAYSEKLVAWILIGIGLLGFYKISKNQSSNIPEITGNSRDQLFYSFGIGIVHGLAGVSHFILLLPILSFKSELIGMLYLFGFAMGTISAMTLYTFLIGKTAQLSTSSDHLMFKLRIFASLFAFVIGCYWLYLA